MAPRPGTQVVLQDLAPPVGVPTDTGVWFVVGLAEKGPVLKPVKIQNMSDYATFLGNRVAYGVLYDALDTFFREGGKTAYVQRIVGPAAVLATKTLTDAGALVSTRVNAKNPGPWGNNLKVQVVAGVTGGSVNLVILDGTTNAILEQSPDALTKADLVAWSTYSNYVDVVDLGIGTIPAVAAAAALTTGADDQASITDTHWSNGLNLFTSDLGPGQVSYPGRTTTVAYNQLTLHAGTRNRVALLDGADTPTAATLNTAGTTQRTDANAKFSALFAPWVKVPGLTPNTTRDVPPSAVAAGLMGRNDANASPNRAAAGNNGISRYALDVKNVWDDTTRDTLNTSGVNIIVNRFGNVKLFGYRTSVNPNLLPNWVQLNNVRLYMAIVAKGLGIAEEHVFRSIDGRGLELSAFGGDLKGMLTPYFDDGSLYGATPQEAYSVDVSDAVNTPTTIAAGELHALISLRMSPFAELVVLQIVKVPITQSLT